MRLYALFLIFFVSSNCVLSNSHKLFHRNAHNNALKHKRSSDTPINSKNQDDIGNSN